MRIVQFAILAAISMVLWINCPNKQPIEIMVMALNSRLIMFAVLYLFIQG